MELWLSEPCQKDKITLGNWVVQANESIFAINLKSIFPKFKLLEKSLVNAELVNLGWDNWGTTVYVSVFLPFTHSLLVHAMLLTLLLTK